MEELAQHRRKDDAWAAYNGKVYNITPYLKFHPGGVGELMRSAGKDGALISLFCLVHPLIGRAGTDLFSEIATRFYQGTLLSLLTVKTHAWVSIDGMLDSAMIGYLVRG